MVIRVEGSRISTELSVGFRDTEGSRNVREQGSEEAPVFGCWDNPPKQELLAKA